MGFFLNQLVLLTPLWEGITLEQVQVTAWALSSPEIFDLLTRVQCWSESHVNWLSSSLVRLLLLE